MNSVAAVLPHWDHCSLSCTNPVYSIVFPARKKSPPMGRLLFTIFAGDLVSGGLKGSWLISCTLCGIPLTCCCRFPAGCGLFVLHYCSRKVGDLITRNQPGFAESFCPIHRS